MAVAATAVIIRCSLILTPALAKAQNALEFQGPVVFALSLWELNTGRRGYFKPKTQKKKMK
jgi:hypothetical protein